MFEYVPFRSNLDEAERVYRAYPYGPRLEVFLLDERSYRGTNGTNREAAMSPATAMLGREQLDWLKARLLTSSATWKVMATDMPLGLIVRDGERDGQPAFEAWANGEGPPLGRELELAELLSFIRTNGIRNVVWITADVHYAAALHYDPARAVTKDFLPFWEFVAGPLHAGNFGPNAIDPTFGPEVKYQSAQPGGPQNRPPSEGYQYFGTLTMDGGQRQAVRGAVRRSRRATLRRGYSIRRERRWSRRAAPSGAMPAPRRTMPRRRTRAAHGAR